MAKIKEIKAREILDSRGNPTVEVDVILDDGSLGRAAVPSGASTGEHEALELRDNDKTRYLGKGVVQAVQNVTCKIAPLLIDNDPRNQQDIDDKMLKLDGTPTKSVIGANAILGVSLACARAAANNVKLPLYKYLRTLYSEAGNDYKLPVPLMNILNGGKHADSGLDIQEFMIVPCGTEKFSEAIRMGVEVFHNLKKILAKQGQTTSVGDEGGFAPGLASNEEALKVIMQAIEKAGYEPGKDICLALDPAASEFYSDGSYKLDHGKTVKSGEEMVKFYENLVSKYPIVSIEDGLAEDDWATWKLMTDKLGKKIQIVGDDLFVTNTERLEKGIAEKTANSILIKVNQIGSLTETINAVAMAHRNSYTAVISHRSGETEDAFIADLAVGLNTGQIKTGSASRSERLAKYNQLLRIEEELGAESVFLGRKTFKI